MSSAKVVKSSTVFIGILIIWFIINIIQSVVTDIIPDESYYFFYSKELAWGYYDHPPLVALMISISSLLFSNELAVRFLTVLLQLFTLLLIWKTIPDKKESTEDVLAFFGISASIVMFVTYGFVTTPDSPLLFFTALFILSYKRFLVRESLLNSLMLSIAMAGLVYSKYQGGLVIVFVVLSNPRLLLNYKFLLSGIAALVLLVPHFAWQYNNDFPSLMYHTIGRSKPFKLRYFLEYLPNQAASFNPVALFITGYILFKYRFKDSFEKSLVYVIVGFILFFWITTLRGHAQPQWTIAASIPMIIIIFSKSRSDHSVKKMTIRYLFPTILILFTARVILACDSFPVQLEFHNQNRWSQNIKEISQGRAVIFRDGYQKPSIYSFYTKEDAFTVNSVFYRQNQYDLHGFYNNFLNRPVVIVTDRYDSLAIPHTLYNRDTLYLHFSESIVLTNDVSIDFSLSDQVIKRGDKLFLTIQMFNKGINNLPFNHPQHPVSLHAVFLGKGFRKSIQAQTEVPVNNLEGGENKNLRAHIIVPEDFPTGLFNLTVSLKAYPFREGYNSKALKLTIE